MEHAIIKTFDQPRLGELLYRLIGPMAGLDIRQSLMRNIFLGFIFIPLCQRIIFRCQLQGFLVQNFSEVHCFMHQAQ
jgi:hypothetical protein